MKKLLAVPIVAVLAFFAMHAAHIWTMVYWLWYGQWNLAFYQSYCSQDGLENLLFHKGGMIWILGFLLPLLIVFLFRKFKHRF